MARSIKWTLVILLSLLLALSQTALADGGKLSGQGTASSPYRIASAADWAAFAEQVAAGESAGRHYKLTANIAADVCVGTKEHPFTGVFDGDGNTLSFSYFDEAYFDREGMAPFRYISGATIRELNVTGSVHSYGHYLGGLVGLVLPDAGASAIENCQVATDVQGLFYCSGVAGNATTSELSVSNTVFSGKAKALSSAGFVGWCRSGASLRLNNCLSTSTGNGNGYNGMVLKESGANVSASFSDCYYIEGKDSFGGKAGLPVSANRPDNGFCREFIAADGNTYYQGCKLQNVAAHYAYTGSAVMPDFVVKNGSGEVVPPELYSVTLRNTGTNKAVDAAVEAGEYLLTVESNGSDGYAPGKLTARFDVGNYALVDYASRNVWYELDDAINRAEGHTYISLRGSFAFEGGRYTFKVPAGKDIVIDLNGKTLDPSAKMWRETYYRSIFRVSKGAKLKLKNGTIRDLSFVQGGGAIWNEGEVTLENVNIENIYSNSNGGGIHNQGTMVIRGGRVTGCSSGANYDDTPFDGGGISNEGTLTIDGAVIKNNSTQGNGGGIYNKGTLTINSGVISGNTAGKWGGGVYLSDDTNATLYLNGGTIKSNTCVNNGGGVHVSETAFMHVSGKPVVADNKKGEDDNNVKLTGKALIQVDGPLTGGANLCITPANERDAITRGYSASNSASPRAYFASDLPGYDAVGRNGEVAIDILASQMPYIERGWNGASVTEERKYTDEDTAAFPNSTSIDPGWYVLRQNITTNGRVSLKGDTHLVLSDGCTLDVKGLYIPKGSTLTVYGQSANTGRIYSHPSGGAGIGAYSGHKGGNIVIHGGTIEAKGYDHCAGIGANDGNLTDVGSFTMYGGTVKATGGNSGAGIGGGRACTGGTITIYGGNVTAQGGHYGAGIGGGNGQDKPVKGAHGGTITIWGGTIQANGGDDGAGIGGGEGGNAGTIVINGGTITARGGNNSAGIGCGEGESTGRGGSVTINGGTVTATGGNEGAGIGSGEDGWIDAITITGGTVTANGGRLAAAIGGGNNVNSGPITITGGTVTANRHSDNGFGIGSGDDCDGSTKVYLGVEKAEGSDIRVTASNFKGRVTLNQPFEIADRLLGAGPVSNNGTLTGGTLVGVDSKLHEHDGIAFQSWNSANSLPTAPGSYYLLSDVTLETDWDWNGGTMNLCLNGHTIRAERFASSPFLLSGGTLNLYDGEGGGLITQVDGQAETIYISNSAAFNMYGGTISGGTEAAPAVTVHGSFHMAGGSISDNCHGVLVAKSGRFTVSGSARVADNKSDVSLIDGRIRIGGKLAEDCRIGVTANPGVLTEGLPGNGTLENFFSNSGEGMIGLNADGEAVLGAPVTLSFETGDESALGAMEDAKVAAGSVYTLPECGFTAPEGMTFTGWLVSEEVKQPGETVTLAEDATVTAQWQWQAYNVTLLPGEADGAAVPGEAVTISSEETGIAPLVADDNIRNGRFFLDDEGTIWFYYPDCPYGAPEGYIFVGWRKEGEERAYKEGNLDQAGTYTLVAQWAARYTVTAADLPEYVMWAGNLPAAAGTGESILPLMKMEPEAWDAGCRVAAVIVTDGKGGVTEITTDMMGRDLPDSALSQPGNDGWIAIIPRTYKMPADDVTFSARIIEPSEEAAPEWTVSFYENGGEGDMESVTAADQSEYVLPESGFAAPEGMEFAGWELDGQIHAAGESIVVTGDALLTATWKTIAEPEEPVEQPAEEPAEQPAEEPVEQPAEEPVEQPVEQPAEEPVEQPAEEPAEQSTEEVESAAEPALVAEPAEEPAEQPAEEPVEQPAEEPVEQSAEEPVEQPAEEPVELPDEEPVSTRMCTISFDGGGADGEMSPVQAAEGSEYTMPACAYYLDGCIFDVWMVEVSGSGETFACQPGDRIIVDGDMTVSAYWLWDETAAENQAEESVEDGIEYGEEEEVVQDSPDDGLEIVYDEVPEAVNGGDIVDIDISSDDVAVESDDGAAIVDVDISSDDVAVESDDGAAIVDVDISSDDVAVESDDGAAIVDVEDDAPSEVGSVFSGAGIAAIIAAAILVLAAAGIAVSRKKK